MLRGASWICLSVQQIVKIQYPAKMKLLSNWSFSWGIGTMFLFYVSLDLLCSEVHVGPFILRDLWTFYAQRSKLDRSTLVHTGQRSMLDLLYSEINTGCFMITGPCWTFYAQKSKLDRSTLDLFMLRGPCWTFYAQMSTLDLLCSEANVGPLKLRCPGWTCYAQSSMLSLLCSKVHDGPIMIRCPSWTFYAYRSTLDLLCPLVHAVPFMLRDQRHLDD